MANCMLCSSVLNQPMTIKWLLSFRPVETELLCNKCRTKFTPIDASRACKECSKPHQSAPYCGDCLEWHSRSTVAFVNQALYEYNLTMKEFMHRYKFVGDYRLRELFAAELSAKATASGRIIVPIPLTPRTLLTRGFNQTKGLLNGPVVECLATRATNKLVEQSKQSRDRRKSMEQPFRIVDQQIMQIQDQDVLIVDDVYTTGTTIRFAAQLLMANGARSVQGLTLAR